MWHSLPSMKSSMDWLYAHVWSGPNLYSLVLAWSAWKHWFRISHFKKSYKVHSGIFMIKKKNWLLLTLQTLLLWWVVQELISIATQIGGRCVLALCGTWYEDLCYIQHYFFVSGKIKHWNFSRLNFRTAYRIILTFKIIL